MDHMHIVGFSEIGLSLDYMVIIFSTSFTLASEFLLFSFEYEDNH